MSSLSSISSSRRSSLSDVSETTRFTRAASKTQRKIVETVTENLQQINYATYRSERSPHERCSSKAIILSSVGIGMVAGGCVGAAVGTAGLGAGAVPGACIGAAIGGGIGLGIGISIVAGMEGHAYSKWKKSKNEAVLADLNANLLDIIKANSPEVAIEDLTCPITHDIPSHPVKTPYTNQCYDRKALEEWVKKNGTDPMTDQKLTVEDLRTAGRFMGLNNETCKKLIDGTISAINFSADQFKGVIALQQDLEKNIYSYYGSENEFLNVQLKNGTITIKEHAMRLCSLANELNPD